MQANLNAAWLVSLVLITLYLIYQHGAKPNFHSVSGSTVVGGALLFMNAMISIHPHNYFGSPFAQVLIPMLCFVAIALFLKSSLIRSLSIGLFAIMSVVLSFQFIFLISPEGEYAGLSENTYNDQMKQRNLRSIRMSLSDVPDIDSKSYRAGWISELPFMNHIPEMYRKHAKFQSIKTQRLWHTWFTGLWQKYPSDKYEIWYPGGNLAHAYDELEFRKRAQ